MENNNMPTVMDDASPAPDTGTEATPATNAADDQTAQPAAENTPPASTAEPGGDKPPTTPTRTLLDDDEEAPPAAADASSVPSEEDITKFCSGITAADLGDGVTWSDDALRAMAPSLMELTQGDPAKAEGVVKAYSEYMRSEAKRQQEAAEAFNDGLIRECKARFGADIKKVAKFAREGGREIFGDELWSALKATPAFANNPEVLDRLARHGRRIAADNGVEVPKVKPPAEEEGDVIHRLYGKVNVG